MEKHKIEWISFSKSGYDGKIDLLERVRESLNSRYRAQVQLEDLYIDSVEQDYDIVAAALEKEPPFLVDDGAELLQLSKKLELYIEDYCVKHKIFFTDYQHHSTKAKAVPVVDGKYVMQFTFVGWSRLMLHIWERVLHVKLYMNDFYCNTVPEQVQDYLERCRDEKNC